MMCNGTCLVYASNSVGGGLHGSKIRTLQQNVSLMAALDYFEEQNCILELKVMDVGVYFNSKCFFKKGYNTSQMFFHLHSSEDLEVGMPGMTNLNLFGFLHYVPSLNTII